jgi:hypothetical protein
MLLGDFISCSQAAVWGHDFTIVALRTEWTSLLPIADGVITLASHCLSLAMI